ncbi:SigE family RNA polymerase sigma factor [Actinomadura rudentiformis]|uniref:SigE family RNA polymerase sigma factor n=1 Tax=Actinomadura rudentiformis TaxID=359158 RepID=A0A6H9YFN0_9ACTN|nr:SigE family RNA polymerase sigma factor [Actinomadura rudentiformis]KAB2340535.1 SigE family RNA polymerase sigma factor [Actinomadura rudentiformis]
MRESPEFTRYAAEKSPRLFKTAYLLCRDRGLAEDLVQITLVKTWRAWRRIEDDPDPYVYRILVNSHASSMRRLWRREIPTDEPPEASSEDELSRLDTRAWILAALARLPRRQQAVIVLRFFEDMTEPQVAAVLDCSVGTVKSQTSKALAKLRLDPQVMVPIACERKG